MTEISDILGWLGAIVAMTICLPQLANVKRVSRWTYRLAAVTHLAYFAAGILSDRYWLCVSSGWGLVIAGLLLWKLRKRDLPQ